MKSLAKGRGFYLAKEQLPSAGTWWREETPRWWSWIGSRARAGGASCRTASACSAAPRRRWLKRATMSTATCPSHFRNKRRINYIQSISDCVMSNPSIGRNRSRLKEQDSKRKTWTEVNWLSVANLDRLWMEEVELFQLGEEPFSFSVGAA